MIRTDNIAASFSMIVVDSVGVTICTSKLISCQSVLSAGHFRRERWLAIKVLFYSDSLIVLDGIDCSEWVWVRAQVCQVSCDNAHRHRWRCPVKSIMVPDLGFSIVTLNAWWESVHGLSMAVRDLLMVLYCHTRLCRIGHPDSRWARPDSLRGLPCLIEVTSVIIWLCRHKWYCKGTCSCRWMSLVLLTRHELLTKFALSVEHQI